MYIAIWKDATEMRKSKPCCKFYDERQAIERGKAFRNGYISLALAMFVCLFVRECCEWDPVDNYSMFLLCLWVSLAVVSVTLIVKNAYDGIYEGRNAATVWIMGVAGVICLIYETVSGVKGKFSFYHDIGALFSGICLVLIFVVYMVKRSTDRKLEKTEEHGKKIS